MKIQVSKALRGTLMLSTVSLNGLKPNQVIDVTGEQFWNNEVQNAVKKKLVTVVGATDAPVALRKVTNTSLNSISLPGYGILRPGKYMLVKVSDLSNRNFSALLNAGAIKDNDKPKEPKSDPTQEKAAAIVWKPESPLEKAPAKKRKSKTIKKLHDENVLLDLSIENGLEPGETDDGIKFVDVEDSERRMAEHPNLKGKKLK